MLLLCQKPSEVFPSESNIEVFIVTRFCLHSRRSRNVGGADFVNGHHLPFETVSSVHVGGVDGEALSCCWWVHDLKQLGLHHEFPQVGGEGVEVDFPDVVEVHVYSEDGEPLFDDAGEVLLDCLLG